MKKTTILFFTFMISAVSWQGNAQSCSNTIPFAESFENGNTDGAVLGGCWSQQSILGVEKWITRTQPDSYDRSARTGNEYITLSKNNEDWIFYALQLEAGKYYKLKFYAKQDNQGLVSVQAAYGTAPSASAMQNNPIVKSTGVSNTFKAFTGTFTPLNTGVYYIGIKGKHNNSFGNFLSLDDVSVNKITPDYVFDGSWSPSDPSTDVSPTKTILVKNGNPILTGNIYVNNLFVKPGASLGIKDILYLTPGGTVINDGEMIFISDINGDGELAQVAEDTYFLGNGIVTMQRYMSNNRAYRMVSSSVTTTTSIHANFQEGASSRSDNPHPGFGTHITGTNGVDQTNGFDKTITGNPSMFKVDIPAQQFVPVANTDVNTLTAGKAYLLFVRGDRSIDLDNNNSEGSTVLRASGRLAHGFSSQVYNTAAEGQWAMFGNPYQSAIDMEEVLAGSQNVNNRYMVVYDPTVGSHGAYVTVDVIANVNSYQSQSTADKYLQVGQGAQATNITTGDITINFHQINKAPGNKNNTNSTGNRFIAENKLSVQLYTSERYKNGDKPHDAFVILFDDNNSNELTQEDALKPSNFYENFGIDHNGTLLSIERRELPQPAEIFQLYSNGYSHEDYTLKLDISGLSDTSFYLNDNFTGSSILLAEGENFYDFNVNDNSPESKATGRFSIRTEQRLGVGDSNLLSGIRLYPNPINNNTFKISAPNLNGQTVKISVKDMLGREIFTSQPTFTEGTINVDLTKDLKSGVYLVTLSSNGETQSVRIIKK